MPEKQTTQKKEKIAIVMSGGGMQCAYGAGVLLALAEEYKLTEPDILIAPSGSAGAATYYVAGQYSKIALMWIALATDPRFISLFKSPIVDIDYLVREVYAKQLPLNLKRIKKSKTKLLYPAIRARDSMLVYLRARPTSDIYANIRATLAAPFIFGKKVRVKGKYYLDGAFGYSVHDYARQAVKEGATTIVLIINNTREYSAFMKLFLRTVAEHGKLLGQSKAVINATKNAIKTKDLFVPPPGVTLVLIKPKKTLPLKVLGSSKFNYRKALNEGYEDAVTHVGLRAVLVAASATKPKSRTRTAKSR